jgi:hypothetical protein
MSMEQSIAWLSSVGQSGLKSREAANALSRDLLRLTKNQKEVGAVLSKYKIDIYDTNGRLKDLNVIIQQITNYETLPQTQLRSSIFLEKGCKFQHIIIF